MSSVSPPRFAVTIAVLLALCALGSVLGAATASAEYRPEPQWGVAPAGAVPVTVGFSEPVGGFMLAPRR